MWMLFWKYHGCLAALWRWLSAWKVTVGSSLWVFRDSWSCRWGTCRIFLIDLYLIRRFLLVRDEHGRDGHLTTLKDDRAKQLTDLIVRTDILFKMKISLVLNSCLAAVVKLKLTNVAQGSCGRVRSGCSSPSYSWCYIRLLQVECGRYITFFKWMRPLTSVVPYYWSTTLKNNNNNKSTWQVWHVVLPQVLNTMLHKRNPRQVKNKKQKQKNPQNDVNGLVVGLSSTSTSSCHFKLHFVLMAFSQMFHGKTEQPRTTGKSLRIIACLMISKILKCVQPKIDNKLVIRINSIFAGCCRVVRFVFLRFWFKIISPHSK